MDERTRIRRAGAFDRIADAYAQSRPDYPVVAARWLVEPVAGSGDRTRPVRVLDLGAGTGSLTAVLLADGHEVVAVDPSAAMLGRLADAHPTSAVVGRAERIPLRDQSVDAVVVAQAFHWFDHERAVPEIARVLRPGGVASMVWNLRDESVPWVRRLGRIMAAALDPPDPSGPLGLCAAFSPVEQQRFRMWQRLDRAGLVDLARSRSQVALLGPEEHARVLDEVGQLYDAQRGDPIGLALPYDTVCFRAYRTDRAPRE